MSKDNLPSSFDFRFIVLNTKSQNSYIRSMETLYVTTKELIYQGNFIKCDSSCLIHNVSLTDLTKVHFVTAFLIPKRISLFNVYHTPSSKIRFLINSKGLLYLVLDLEVFRTLGLSNCKLVDRNKEDSVTVEIDLTDPKYTSKDSKLYQRLQHSLSKISPTTVVLSSEAPNGIDYGKLEELFEKTSSGFKISQCNSQFQHTRVHIGSKDEHFNTSLKAQHRFSLKFLNDNLNLLKESGDTQVYRKKRRRLETFKPELRFKLEALERNRDVFVKIFNAVKKNSTKNEQTVKNMIHELNKKNVHSDLEDLNENNSPLSNILGFIDNLGLRSLKDSDPGSEGSSESFELLKVNNGIISKDTVYGLFKKSCEVLLRETEVFIMSLYVLSENKMCSEPLVQVRPNSGGYVHIVCRKSTHQDELEGYGIPSPIRD
ncbi:conserved hypothetical protein [Theileria orientalis strain Shintoku]|uniref:Uncharacterized protein n=1 Tax=Theileria orientalis strain Shintoku TaxID=869250 RepID=J4C7S4_THEOR|nr:conserved hypothetical protein [Theileria orientalis strain Shintoku]PVC49538.1 hypothetical protein MACL_00002863 [Theileria orientalis]BAM39543.1 conserved hypothetical protein [Theileria orientalis strain Shintoku]|eukprot:XP_009689844.1 conserved hypothetical protein [Theileria orientalis strain Shintoku]